MVRTWCGTVAVLCALTISASWVEPASADTSVYAWLNFAGQPGGPGNADGTGNAARFDEPTGVAVDGAGNVYVADSGNHTIRKVTPSGVVTTLAGLAGASGSTDGTGSDARFNNPYGVAADGAGNVYVADYGNDTIRKVTPSGVVMTLAGLAGSYGSTDGTGSGARFSNPTGVAVDSAGNAYVADQYNHTIRKVTSSGVVTTLAGLAGSPGSTGGTGSAARFYYPTGLAVDGAGNVYVADRNNHTIRKVTPSGVVTTLAGLAGSSGSTDGTGSAARFNDPAGVAVDGAGNVYVADQTNHTIRKVTPSGVVTTLAGLAGSSGSTDGTGGAARFDQPDGVAVDGAGNVYVADSGNDKIRKVTPSGAVTTLAGLAGSSGSTDGTGSAARFDQPDGVAVDGAGNVYVADYDNNTIRKVTPSGAVTTLAGLAGSHGSTDGTGSAARFYYPYGVAADTAGNVYVADYYNHTIRKVTSAGVVTTLAGLAGSSGSANGTGSAARFNHPTGVAGDNAGNVYVADYSNGTIRKVTSAGVVTTLAGLAGSSGSTDGTGSAARFNYPTGVAVDGAGNVYVADGNTLYGNNMVRKVTPAGVVTTLAGLTTISGSTDGTGAAARFYRPSGVAVDGTGNVYVADTFNDTIRKVTPAGLVTTIGGSPGVSGGADGVGSSANFSGPFGIAVDTAGYLYAADEGNNRISKGTPPPTVTTTSPMPAGTVGVAYSQSLAASGGTAPYTWSIAAGALPAGLTLSSAGLISGTPTAGITADFTAQVTGNDGAFSTADFTLTVLAPLVIASSRLPAGTAGIAYSYTLTATGGAAPYIWSISSGSLPSGLSLSSSGMISGAPDEPGTTGFTVQVAGGNGSSSTRDFNLTIDEPYSWANVAGWPGGSGDADGTGTAARFNWPSGAAVDGAGNVYVADYGNHTIRKVTPSGVVTTLAGLPGSYGSADGTGAAARFTWPSGVAVDGAGNVYVADYGNHTIRKVTASGVVTTLAGLAGASGSTDGTGSVARFNNPSAVAADGAGNVYVADSGNHTIRKVTPSGVVTTLAGLAGASGSTDATGSTARFNNPSGVVADGAGNVYVTDQGNHTIRKVTPSGAVTTLAGLAGSPGSTDGTGSAARFNNPRGVAADGAGNLYVADYGNHTIRKVTPSGVVTTLAGQAGSSGSTDGTGSLARFNNPAGVAADGAGNLYVAGYGNHTIRKVTPSGAVTTLAGLAPLPGSTDGTDSTARFFNPSGVAADGAGNVYVADTYNHTIRKVTSSRVVTTLAGLAGSHGSTDGTGSAARFYYPYGVAADTAGNVYVADYYNHTIRKVTSAGVVTTLAGLAGSSGSTDGAGSAARFYRPRGVAVDTAGNVYVADQYNHTIRKVTPAGAVTTLAGQALSFGSTDGTGSAARFKSPCGVAVDGVGHVYVADSGNHTIRKVTSAGAVTTLAGLAGSLGSTDGIGSTARFNNPYGVAVDGVGNVYVADQYNHTIRKVTQIFLPPTFVGLVTTVGGSPDVIGGADGIGSAANFSSPAGIAVDAAGTLYVADSSNNRISKRLYLTADINADGYINVGDLQLLVAAWSRGPNYIGPADLNSDGYVNVGDLQILIANWGRSTN